MTHDPNHPSPTSSSTFPLALSADDAPRLPIAWVDDLFGRLNAIVGEVAMGRVYDGADVAAVKREWAIGLHGLSGDEVRRGIASVRLRKFAPNLPEFLHLCRPALDPETAWNEAYDGVRAKARFPWSHPAVYWAASDMAYELRNGTYAQHRKRWDALMAAQWLRGSWAPLPLHLGHQPAPKQRDLDGVPVPKEAVTAMLHDLRQRLTGHPTKEAEAAARGGYSDAELADQRRAQQLAGSS